MTPEALQARIQGTMMLTAVIRTDGTPHDIEITQSLDTEYGLDKAPPLLATGDSSPA